ncbi:MAG TPA: DinB family protein [Bacteroidota bacterium]
MTLRNFLAYFDDVVAPTEQLFRLIPPDKLDWKPVDNGFSLGQQIAHLSGALGVYAHGIARGEWGFRSMRERFVMNRHTPSMDVGEAVRVLNENAAEFRSILGSLTEEEFNNGEVDSPQLGRVPRWRLAMLAVEHHINHKAELFMCLKVLGVSVNTGNLYKRQS